MRIFSSGRLVIIFAALSIIGFGLLWKIDFELKPKTVFNSMTISFKYHGASANVIEEKVTSVLENYLSGITDISHIYSRTAHGEGNIRVDFKARTDMSMRRFELTQRIRQVYPLLSDKIAYPSIESTLDMSSVQVMATMVYVLKGSHEPFTIKNTAERIVNEEILRIPGVAKAQVSSDGSRRIVISYNSLKCRSLGISSAEIEKTIRSYLSTSNAYIGRIYERGMLTFLQQGADTINELTLLKLQVSSVAGERYLLSDLATVRIESDNPRHTYYKLNGNNAANVSIFFDENKNALKVAEDVKKRISRLNQQLPKGYELVKLLDKSESLEHEIRVTWNRIGISLVIMLLLVFVVYRNCRHALVIAISLFVTASLIAGSMYLLHVPVKWYTIGGLTVAFGVIQDNLIMVLEYFRYNKSFKSVKVVLGATVLSLLGISLFYLLPDQNKTELSDFSTVVVISICVSVFVSFLFTPALFDLLKSSHNQKTIRNAGRMEYRRFHVRTYTLYYMFVAKMAQYKRIVLLCLVLLFGIPVFIIPDRLHGSSEFDKIGNNLLGNEYFINVVKPNINKYLGGGLRKFWKKVSETDNLIDEEGTRLHIVAQSAAGTTTEQLNIAIGQFEKYLNKVPAVEKFLTHIPSGQYATVEIFFRPEYDYTADIPILKSQLVGMTEKFSGIHFAIYGVGAPFSNLSLDKATGFVIEARGYNFAALERISLKVAKELANNRRVKSLDIDEKREYGDRREQLLELRYNLGQSQLSQSQILVAEKIAPLYASSYTTIGELNMDDEVLPVTLGSGEGNTLTAELIRATGLVNKSGKNYRLGEISRIDTSKAGSVIYKRDREYLRLISFDYMGEKVYGEKFLKTKIDDLNRKMPLGFSLREFRRDKLRRGSLSDYWVLILIFPLTFLIGCVLYEEFKKPLYLLLLIPISFIGLFYTVGANDFFIDQGAFAALFLLASLVTNAGIYLLHDIAIREPKTRRYNKMLVKVFYNRSKTIFLTMISCCCGLVPFLMDGDKTIFWFSFSLGVIGGLLVSIIAILLIFPLVLYRLKNI